MTANLNPASDLRWSRLIVIGCDLVKIFISWQLQPHVFGKICVVQPDIVRQKDNKLGRAKIQYVWKDLGAFRKSLRLKYSRKIWTSYQTDLQFFSTN